MQPLDDTRCNTQNRWRSVDAHFQTGAVTMSPSVLPTKAANTLIMGKCHSLALGLYKMQHPKLVMLGGCSVDALSMLCWCSLSGEATSTSAILPVKASNTLIMDNSHSTAPGWYKMQHTKSLTLCWHSFSEWRCDYVAFCFPNKGCQHIDYGSQWGNCVTIHFLVRLKIVDALLTLIFRTGLLSCYFLFGLERLPILWLWITVSKLLPNWPTLKTKNCWHSINAHYQNVAVTVSHSPLPIKADNMLIMNNSEPIASQLGYLQLQILLTLRWWSHSEWGCYHIAFSFTYQGCQYIGYA